MTIDLKQTHRPLAHLSTTNLGRKKGLSPAAVVRAKGWGVGSIIEAAEPGPGAATPTRLVITAVGEREVLARRMDDVARLETLWQFNTRNWSEV